MGYGDAIRTATTTIEDIADLFDALGSWTGWSPTYSASGSMTYTSVTTNIAEYINADKLVIFRLEASGTTGGTASNELRATLPLTSSGAQSCWAGAISEGGVMVAGAAYHVNTTTLRVQRYDASNLGLGASRIMLASGVYEKA